MESACDFELRKIGGHMGRQHSSIKPFDVLAVCAPHPGSTVVTEPIEQVLNRLLSEGSG